MSMPPQRGTETSELANVIEVIQLGRKTGALTVERSTDSYVETGEITFDNGHIIGAHSSRGMQGQQALLWLKSWTACRFTFVALQEKTLTTQPLPALSQHDLAFKKGSTGTQPVPVARQGATDSRDFDAELLSVPQRIQPLETALQLITQAHLSRTHRQLFLLIDGQRNVAELFRLLGRKGDEDISLLRDLVYINIIR